MPMKMISASKGFSLIEVLIAVVVLAIGLLGMASLMLTSMQSNQNAAERSAATVLSYDLIERMRGNPDQIALYVGNIGDPSSLLNPCDEADACNGGMNAAELAGFDVLTWSNQLQANLPGATATVQALPNNQYCIAVFWPQTQSGMTAANTTACGTDANGRGFTSLQVTL